MCDLCPSNPSRYRISDFYDHHVLYVCGSCLSKALDNMIEYKRLLVEVIN